jgi:hypothetical protein
MHIDKYLCDVKKPTFLPGPFSVRLKYELKQAIFDKKPVSSFHLVYSSAIICLFILCTVFVLNPTTAQRLHTLVFPENQTDTLDLLLMAERDIDLSNYPTTFRTVASELENTLPFLENNKSYLIHKFRNTEDKAFIYISEVKNSQKPPRSY